MEAALEAALRSAVTEPELVADLLESCILQNIGVEQLAQVSAEDITDVATNLFLTPEEAAKLIEACKEHASKGNAEAAAVIDEAREEQTEEAVVQAVQETAPVEQQAPQAIAEEEEEVVTVDVIAVSKASAVKGSKPSKLPAAPSTVTRPASAPVTSPAGKDVPSYLRPTAAFTSRSTKHQEPSSPAPPASASPDKKKTKKAGASNGNFLSRLLSPTATFLARVTRQRAESKEARAAAEAAANLKQSQKLEKVMAQPQGQRVTKPTPFSLHSDGRPKTPTVLPSDEEAMREAKKHAFKPNEIPKGLLTNSKPLEGFAYSKSKPADPTALFKPFQLSSLDKHEKYQALRSARLAEEARKTEEARRFKAQDLDKTLLEHASSPRKPAPAATTTPSAPKFASEARIAYHKEVLEPAKRARMSAVEREKLEAREREVAAEEERATAEAADKERQKQEEAAREAMEAPPPPPPTKASPVTRSIDFKFTTDDRFGRPVSARAREDAAAPALDPSSFATSLRASGSFSPRSLRASTNNLHGAASPSSARRSVKLTQSMALPAGAFASPSSLRASVAVTTMGAASPSRFGASPRGAAHPITTSSRTTPAGSGSSGASVHKIGAALAEALAAASPLGNPATMTCGSAAGSRRGTADLVMTDSPRLVA